MSRYSSGEPTQPTQPTEADHTDRVLEHWARERPELDTSPVAVIARLGRACAYVDQGLQRAFGDEGLTRAAWDVLASLRRAGAPYRLSPTELYRGLMRTSGAMTNRLQQLERAGLVERMPDPRDGRSLLVGLTPNGKALVDRVAPLHLANEERLLAPLDARERRALAALLKKLLVSFEAQEPAAPPAGGRRAELH